MAITRAPLMAFSASGQIGKSLVFGTWKGQKYARSYVIPSNPKSTAQTAQRALFSWVHDAYKYLDSNVSQAWVAYSKGKTLTGPNAWASKNMVALRGLTENDTMIFIPAVLGGPPNAGITVTPGANQLTVVGVPPVVPAGWTINLMIATIMKRQDPTGETEPNVSTTMTKNAAAWSLVFTGLITAQAYVAGVGWQMTRADGVIAYGGSTNANGTPT